MKEKELYNFWKKYIDTDLYRVFSSEYLADIKKNGLNPKKDPHKKISSDIRKLFKLIIKLEKKGFIHEQDWGFKVVTAKFIVRCSTRDINNPYIDFTPWYKETFYYRKRRGGALVTTVKNITEDILARKPKISRIELDLVKKLNKWALKKAKYKNKTLIIKGSSKYFESAYFQRVHSGKKYIKSPFGRFEHFKRVISKTGLKKYGEFLTLKKKFFLRVINRIPAKEIHRIV